MGDRLNMTGLWIGTYRYANQDQPPVDFTALFGDDDGALWGTISEPGVTGGTSDIERAELRGRRHGCDIDFDKIYDGAGDLGHLVHYSGAISPDGAHAAGTWDFANYHGSFTLERSAGALIEQDVDARADVPLHYSTL